MDWVRGETVGRGCFATVSLAIPTKKISPQNPPPVAAVKSSLASDSSTLKNEKQVLDSLGSSPNIIRCLGDDYSNENGEDLYNLLLEYAEGGSLADHVKNCGRRLPETQIRRYTRSILEGLRHIHSKEIAHCDIKLQNILLFGNGDIKIADFGLAKRKTGDKQTNCKNRGQWCGTPLYMSPESINDDEYDSPGDIWALGCAVVEMVTGKPAWNIEDGRNIWSLLFRIGVGEELPEVPEELSEEGKDFIRKCFVKDPRKRWTADMLLNHPFVAGEFCSLKIPDQLSTSPRCHFDFSDWVSTAGTSVPSSPESVAEDLNLCFESLGFSSPVDRIRHLVTASRLPDWSVSDNWVDVR